MFGNSYCIDKWGRGDRDGDHDPGTAYPLELRVRQTQIRPRAEMDSPGGITGKALLTGNRTG